MATYPPDVVEKASPALDDPTLDEDVEVINLRPLLETLFKWWREIFLLTILAAAIGSAIVLYSRSTEQPRYEAATQVAIARVVSNVNLDADFMTAMNSVGPLAQDVNSRRSSLVGLVKNGTIANAVLQELGPLLDGTSSSDLTDKVSASLVGGSVSDLIEIAVISDTPEKAAAIANSWAKHYVAHVNTLYGEMPTEMAEVVELELDKALATYDSAQSAYEAVLGENDIPTLTRQIEEKEELLSTLQAGRQLALTDVISQTLEYRQSIITTYLDTIQQNRLLALTGEQEVNRTLVTNLLQSIGESRQLAFTTEHEARVQLFTQYADLELQNRLLAIKQEQDAKTQIFQSYSDADLQAKLSVFNEQVNAKVGGLVESYATKSRIDQLLDQAVALQQQIEQAGAAGANSNALPLLLLKIEAYAVTTPSTPSTSNDSNESEKEPIRVDLSGDNGLETDIAKQATDIAVLIDTLRERSATLAARIEEESRTLYNNEGYQLLDSVRPEDDALYAAIQEQYLALFQVDDLAQSADSVAGNSVLSQAIIAKYDELFGLGSLANASMTISDTTPIYAALATQYPSLFEISDLTQLGDLLATDSALDSASQQKLIEMLQPPDELERYLAAATAGAQPILNLEEELRSLHATLEQKQAQLDRHLYDRDLALEAYQTLSNKLLELTLQRTAGNREVRLAAAANPPDEPIVGTSLMMTGAIFAGVGFLISVIIAILAAYMKAQPFLSRLRFPQPRPASHASP